MITFLSNVPIWVFPLFVLLLVLGLRARKDREVPIILIAALPLLGIMTLRNIILLDAPFWIWGIAALAYATGMAAGMRWQRQWITARSHRLVSIKGEWVTLAAMMIIFTAGFVNGFLSQTKPDLAQSTLFAVLFTAFTSLPAGQFLGRAIISLRTPVTPSP